MPVDFLTSGTLNQLKETYTHTPSYDLSPAMLSMLIRLMLAQTQECLFEKLALPGIRNQFCPLMKMAQEAAKVKLTWETERSFTTVFSFYDYSVTTSSESPLGNSILSFNAGGRNLRPSPPVHDPDAD